MAIGKVASCVIFAASLWGVEFPVLHEHLRKGCNGTLAVDESGIRFEGAKNHSWSWKYDDIQQLTISPARLHILTYKDSKLRLGADVAYTFAGKIPVDDLYAQWRTRLDQRLVVAHAFGVSDYSIPAKHLATIKGSEGMLTFGAETVVYASPGDSRTWRYSDIRDIASSGPFQLTITTFEKQFNFQLKQAMSETRYNQIWLDIEKKNGRIQ